MDGYEQALARAWWRVVKQRAVRQRRMVRQIWMALECRW